MRLYYLLPDGTYESSFAEDYTIDHLKRVYSRKRNKHLLPDIKGRVWLSIGGKRIRMNVNKLYKDSVMANSQAVVNTFTKGYTKEVHLGEYCWRIPTHLNFVFDTDRVCEIYVREAWEDHSIDRKFMEYISRDKLQHMPAFRPTFDQFVTWSIKYTDALSTLQDAYDLYRDIGLLTITTDYQSIITDTTTPNRVIFHRDGTICTVQNNQIIRIKARQSTPLPYSSSLLANNRLVFGETAGLISGPFTPLLTWAFRGKPQEGHVLYNVTGNMNCYNASNWVWVPYYMVQTYNQMRRWLTRLWYYEVMG